MKIVGRHTLIKLNTFWTYIPFLMACGAIVLFTIAYVSHSFLGDNNVIEETAEDLLKKEYKIEVEFSVVKEKEK